MERIHSTFGFIVHNLSLYNAPLKKEKKKKKAFEQILLGICGSFHRKRFILQVFTRRVCVIFTQTIAKI